MIDSHDFFRQAVSYVQLNPVERPRLSAERFVELLCGLLEVEPSRPASRVRDRSTPELRRVLATLGVARWSQQGTARAAVLEKSSDVVS